MHQDFTFSLNEEQFNKLQKTLRDLSTLEREAAISEALGKGMANMVNVGKSALQHTTLHPGKGTGNLKKSLVSKVEKANRRKGAKGIAGFKRSKKKEGIGGGNHSFLVDRGTKERWQKKTGRYTGSVRKGRPQTGSLFWSKTVDSEGPKALDMLMQGINDAIIDILNR